MKRIIFTALVFLLLFVNSVLAHTPDLSNLMIYEQNGKNFLVIKSSLTAFESEINFIFGKNSYKSPEDFQKLAIKFFRKNCLLIIDDDTIKMIHPHIILGHETTLFVELSEVPKVFKSIFIKNTLFKDMPSNMCEIILAFKDLPQKQVILDGINNHQVNLSFDKNNWYVADSEHGPLYMRKVFLWISFFILILLILKRITKIKKVSSDKIEI